MRWEYNRPRGPLVKRGETESVILRIISEPIDCTPLRFYIASDLDQPICRGPAIGRNEKIGQHVNKVLGEDDGDESLGIFLL